MNEAPRPGLSPAELLDVSVTMWISHMCICHIYIQNQGTLAGGARLSSVAMQQSWSDVVEVRAAGPRLQVLQNQNLLPLGEQRWMDLHGEAPQMTVEIKP